MLTITVTNTSNRHLILGNPIQNLAAGKTVTLPITVAEAESLAAVLIRLSNSNSITYSIYDTETLIDFDVLTSISSADDADLLVLQHESDKTLRKITKLNLVGSTGATMLAQEMHKITAAEVTVGYFTLAQTPLTQVSVGISIVGGIRQINKQCVGTTGATPDFDVLYGNRLYINNNGDATGLSGDIIVDNILIIDYIV
jgi:hypothetical protein